MIDVSQYPLGAQKLKALGTRRIGLGVTGLGDMLVMLGIAYGSEESIRLAKELMQKVSEATWQTSIELAQEKEPFPFFQSDYLEGAFVKTLNASLREQLTKYAVRNSHHNTIAPTGTISLLANNVSNGIEPIFLASYDRHIRAPEGDTITFEVNDYAYHLWKEKNPNETLPPAWQDTQMLMPDAHLNIQAAMQPFIDNSISKTINIPVDFPFKKLTEVYTQAYQLGLKGCTIFRPNDITGSVMEVPEERCCQFEGELNQE